MKLRALALAGAAALSFSTPALAMHTGWYLGLGVGYDQLMSVHMKPSISPAFQTSYSGNAIYLVNGGYKWDSGWRVEAEFAFDNHDASKLGPTYGSRVGPFTPHTLAGGTSTTAAMVNVVYDFHLGERWLLSLGGGVGAGDVNHYEDLSNLDFNTDEAVDGVGIGFAWQGIAGLDYEISNSVDVYADYRYRAVELGHNYSGFALGQPIHISRQQENVGLVGLRWYTGHEAPPPPPLPPPLPPPAPVKTFIVFFDFDKSNLTEKAQEVVAEAVRTAKANGFVKVLVTGHTDTVGSDSYNQALSIRRAQSVKDEMVREGLDGGGIEIVGKSFHDPLVPTGPGVREPQNRRAVIDLGG